MVREVFSKTIYSPKFLLAGFMGSVVQLAKKRLLGTRASKVLSK